MPSLSELAKKRLQERKINEDNINTPPSIEKPKEVVIVSKIPKSPKQKETPKGYMTIKIPENIDDLRIGNLRTIYASIFGKEPPHDKIHGKFWIAEQIKKILTRGE